MSQKPSYSLKALRNIALGALVLFISLQVAVWASTKIKQNHTKHLAAVEQQKLHSLSKEEQAIYKAQTKLTQSVSSIDSSERLIIAYLQRRFDLNKSLDANTHPITVPKDNQPYSLQIKYLARIAYPNMITRDLPPKDVSGAALTNIYAANCDVLPFPANFWPTMEENFRAGGYSLTHILLALAFMKDNGCAVPSNEQDLSSRTSVAMVKLMDDPNTPQDMRYEIVAFLQLAGHADAVKPQWIEQILSKQLADGSWVEKRPDPQSRNHTTVLALWALLEYNRPGTPYEPLIHRPNN